MHRQRTTRGAARATGDAYALGETIAAVGNYVALVNNDEHAIAVVEEGLEIARRLGNQFLLGSSLAAAGTAYYLLDPARGIELFTESLGTSVHNTPRDSQSRFFIAQAWEPGGGGTRAL